MELTISQLNSASPNWTAKARSAVAPDARLEAPAPKGTENGATLAAVRETSGAETEYDQFGRFGVMKAEESEASYEADDKSRAQITANKNFRAGKATISQLEQEYVRSLMGGTQSERGFIPAGMTEYQVSGLTDYQYRWAIDAERRALVANPSSSTPDPQG